MLEIYAAGAVAAFTVDVLVYPLDTLKTRYQSQDFMKNYATGAARKALAQGGLYQGIGSVILATLPAAGLFFSTYESAKVLFARASTLPEPIVHSAASATAELASCLILTPAEVIKQNAQMLRKGGDGSGRSTSVQALRQLGGAGGVSRLFRGYTALVARNLPFTALQFPVFEHIRARLWESRLQGPGRTTSDRGLLETGMISAASAGSAGAVAAFLTTPSDVIKTRMMLAAGMREEHEASGSRGVDQQRAADKGAMSVAKDVYRTKGLRGFFRGGLFRSAWTALGSGLYLGSYDVARVWLKRRNPDLDDSVGL